MTVKYNADQKIPRPVCWPVLDRSAIRYWDGVKEKKLELQRCKQCGTYLHPPRPMCGNCQSMEFEWVPASGKGTVYSHATYRQGDNPAFEAPYAVVLVELEEGVRMVSNMTDCEPENIKIGMPVEMVLEEIAEDLILPKFKKAG